ncbi:cation-translocating P-type ATPase [Nocardia goodfellowii]|uniref:Cation-transporting ATPase I n=1 Tax=Nocardia goodfellowii TaxID=882446 RepID=A0ABS4QJ00_9NOCA|nr:cation-translocating P-type ATPase [Nocardia goodfellowii]MBP2191689.1 cation-transporting ATPase I [Nocardia goodfellowii]
MGFSLRNMVSETLRGGSLFALGMGLKVAEIPIHALESGVKAAAHGMEAFTPEHLRADLAALVDPSPERTQRRVAVHEDRASVEVHGLATGKHAVLTRELDRELERLGSVRDWKVNTVTGRLIAELKHGEEDLQELLHVIEQVEDNADVTDIGWSRRTEFPADREPLLAAGIQVAGDLAAIAVSTAGLVLPFQPPLRALRGAAAVIDTQPRVRRLLEARLGRTRADLVLALANAIGNAAGGEASESLANLLVDTVQRTATLTEALTRHNLWRSWEAELASAHSPGVADPLPPHTRPCELPPGPVERVADETAAGALFGATAFAGNARASEAADALQLGAPKAARAAREAYAATVSTTLARAGVLTLYPAVWRRLDRLTTMVIDGEALLTARRVVLEVEALDPRWRDGTTNSEAPEDEQRAAAQVWSAAQRLLRAAEHKGRSDTEASAADDTHENNRTAAHESGQRLRLVHPNSGTPDRGATLRPAWRELRDGDRPVGRVLVGRELDRRAHAVLTAARNAGLRVVLSAGEDVAELRSLADEFLNVGISLSKYVHQLQEDGHVVAVLSPRAHKALAWADAGIGLCGKEDSTLRLPWSSDVVCRDLSQVQRVLAAVAPARATSERGRALALSGCALGALLLATGPGRRGRTSPMLTAQVLGLANGAFSGWQAVRGMPSTTLAPLLPWHALQPDEVLSRLPDPLPVAERTAPKQSHRERILQPLAPALAFGKHVRDELADPLTPILGVGAIATAILGSPSDAILLSSVLTVNAVISARQRQKAESALHELLAGEELTARLVDRNALSATAASVPDREIAHDTSPHPIATLEKRDSSPVRSDSVAAIAAASGATADGGGSGSEGTPLRVRDLEELDLGNGALAGQEVPARQLTIGDLIVLRGGDVVPADARLLVSDDLEMDESGLTGESVTVAKQLDATPGADLGDRACMVFEGSTVVSGSALAVVVAVGAETQAGRATAGAIPPEKGGVQAQLRRLTQRALPLTLAGGAAVTALGGLRGRTLRTAIADGVGVAVAAVPEGLPLVATVAQLAAARRLSRYGVLVRASRTVEALGRVDTLCFDKTGTLTEGRLRLTTLADLDEQWEPDAEADSARRLLRAAARACPDPADGPVLHATDRAVLEAADILGDDAHKWDPIDEIPFESNRGYAAALGQTTRRLRLVVKGAPEVVLPRCTKIRTADGKQELPQELRDKAEQVVRDLAEQGLRVLVVARRDLSDRPDDVEGMIGELTLLGFLGLADTPRPQTLPLVKALQDNDISVRMITGDHPVTAAAVARQLGIDADEVTTGADLDRLDDKAQTELIERSTVFARVTPEQKVRIVASLRRGGHVVGMTGDGSNDAAAIRTADIGIGLAAHGSAAARNAADLVLTDPDPTALLHALVEGRGMWQRINNAVGVLVGGNAGEVAFTLYGTAVAGAAPLGTRQFLLVNMLTDMFPALALALSPDRNRPDPGIDSARAAEHRAAQLAEIPPASLGAELARTIAVRGIATAAGASGAWTVARWTGTQRRAATVGLVALIGTQLGQTLLSGRTSPLVWATTAASAGVLGVVVMTPGLCHYFGCTPLGPVGWSIATTSAVAATAGAALLPHILPSIGADTETDADTDAGA